MFFQYTYQLKEFIHEPVHPLEAHDPGQVFLREWQRLMAEEVVDPETDEVIINPPPNAKFVSIFEQRVAGHLDQRCATVAASLVAWLGSNCGLAMLCQAEELCKKAGGLFDVLPSRREHWYRMAFALENERAGYRSDGLRLIEHLLVPQGGFRMTREGRKELTREPELKYTDFEIMEGFMVWAAGPEGSDFVRETTDRCREFRRHRADEVCRAAGNRISTSA